MGGIVFRTSEYGDAGGSNALSMSHYLVAAGSKVTVGGAAAEDISIPGVVATDLAFAILTVRTNRTILQVAAGADKITVTFSGDPSTAHTVHYFVYREM